MPLEREPVLTRADDPLVSAFLSDMLNGFKSGELTEAEAIAGLEMVILSVDRGQHERARRWLLGGRQLVGPGEGRRHSRPGSD